MMGTVRAWWSMTLVDNKHVDGCKLGFEHGFIVVIVCIEQLVLWTTPYRFGFDAKHNKRPLMYHCSHTHDVSYQAELHNAAERRLSLLSSTVA